MIRLRDVKRFEEVEDSTCARDGIADRSLVALGLRTSPHMLSAVRRAWRIDRDAGRFRGVRAEGVTCEPEYPYGHEDEWHEIRRRQVQ